MRIIVVFWEEECWDVSHPLDHLLRPGLRLLKDRKGVASSKMLSLRTSGLSCSPQLRQAGTGDLGCSACIWTKASSKQQNTKKLEGTKNNCVHVQLGKIRNKRYQESKKPNSHFWRTWSKNMVSGAKVRHWTCSSHTSPRGWAKLLRPLEPDPGHTPTLALFKETAHHTPRGGSKQGNLVFVLASPCCSRGPNKALPEFQKKKKNSALNPDN